MKAVAIPEAVWKGVFPLDGAVHHELVAQGCGEAAAELQGVGQRLVAVVESEADAGFDSGGDAADELRLQLAADRQTTQGNRKTRFLLPPGTEIQHGL